MTNMNAVEMNDEMMEQVNGGKMSAEDQKKCMDLIAGLDSTEQFAASRIYSTLENSSVVLNYKDFSSIWLDYVTSE